ncbi:MAG TPA: hypothetical protein VHG51_01260 [Longimicrobiaceae bacterium]|nr:hypothetical protein [Longimicrobiaceae bacterium]
MRAQTLSLIGLVLALAACQPDPASVAGPEAATAGAQVTVSRADGGLRLTNATDRPVAFNVRNPDWLGLLAACTDPGPSCARLAPGASVFVPFSEVAGFAPGARQVAVTWWHVVADGAGGYRVEEFHDVALTL